MCGVRLPWEGMFLTTILFFWPVGTAPPHPRGLDSPEPSMCLCSPSAGLTSAPLCLSPWADEDSEREPLQRCRPLRRTRDPEGTILDSTVSAGKHWRRLEADQNHLPTADGWHHTIQPPPPAAPDGQRTGSWASGRNRPEEHSWVPDEESVTHHADKITFLQPPTDLPSQANLCKASLTEPE